MGASGRDWRLLTIPRSLFLQTVNRRENHSRYGFILIHRGQLSAGHNDGIRGFSSRIAALYVPPSFKLPSLFPAGCHLRSCSTASRLEFLRRVKSLLIDSHSSASSTMRFPLPSPCPIEQYTVTCMATLAISSKSLHLAARLRSQSAIETELITRWMSMK